MDDFYDVKVDDNLDLDLDSGEVISGNDAILYESLAILKTYRGKYEFQKKIGTLIEESFFKPSEPDFGLFIKSIKKTILDNFEEVKEVKINNITQNTEEHKATISISLINDKQEQINFDLNTNT